MTFAEFCQEMHVTAAERDALAWHLAMYRARRTWEALRV